MPGLIIANLLAEEAWAGRSAQPGKATLARLGLSAGLLAVLARDEADALWIPEPIPLLDLHFPSAPTSFSPPLVSGGVPRHSPNALLVWAATDATDRWRPAPVAASSGTRSRTGIAWLDALWSLPLVSGQTSRPLASRSWTLALAGRLGLSLPGARMVADEADLSAHLSAGGGRASPSGSWVLKAAWSAAGRQRIVVGADGPSNAQRRWMRTGFMRGDGLLFEPWMSRQADVGCVAMVDASGVQILGAHGQSIDALGRFQGLTLWPGCRLPAELPQRCLSPADAKQLEAVVLATGSALAAEGYAGPFGVDAWSYVDTDGQERFHPLGEVNVRCTMGLVARAWIERLGLAADGRGWRLRFGEPRPADPAAMLLVDAGTMGLIWLEPLQ